MSKEVKSVPVSAPKVIIKELSDRDWLLKRGHNIIGSLEPVELSGFLFDSETEKFNWTNYTSIPGLIKIIFEIFDNSMDVAIKTKYQSANKITVKINDDTCQITDNGYGIPVEKSGDKWIPEMAWGQPRTGSNFEDDENRTHIGMNGIGSYATAVFSKDFIGITDDGKNRLKVQFQDNLETTEITELPTKKQGTSVTFQPDLTRFNLEKIDSHYKSLVYQRILNLSIMYPKINFKFNGINVKASPKKFMAQFSDNYEIIEHENYMIGIFPSTTGEFQFHSYVNSLWLSKGGNHLNLIAGKVIESLREKLVKKFKTIKPGDIKSKLGMVVFFKDFQNPAFDGQTKEFLTNTQKEISDFLDTSNPDVKKTWNNFFKKIIKNQELMEPIIFHFKAKLQAEENLLLKSQVKKQDLPEKYWPAVSRNKYFFAAEGDSAINAIIAELRREENGFFPLKGAPLNVIKDKKKVSSNTEIKQLAGILGIDLTSTNNDNLTYENIVIATDADVDGHHIAGILLGFFAMYCPEYLKQGKIFRFITPLITVYTKNNDVHGFCFTTEHYQDFRKESDPDGSKYIYDYKKGLGTLEEKEWAKLFQTFTLEDLLQPLHLLESEDPAAEIKELIMWLTEDPSGRKIEIQKTIKDFDINSI